MSIRKRRLTCLLFTPVLKEGWAEKAWNWQPDGVILDLEDSIPESDKDKARKMAKLISNNSPKNWFLRINSIGSGHWEEDLHIALTTNIAGILIPKVENPEDVTKIHKFLTESVFTFSNSHDLPVLVPIIETALGLENVMRIATSSPLIYTLAFGAADFTNDIWLEGNPSRAVLEHAKFRISIASRAAGLYSPHDSPYFKLEDADGLLQEVLEAKTLAFGGKYAIHPSQIKVIKDNFRPTNEEMKRALTIVSMFENGLKEGKAAIRVNNEMVDYPIFKKAKNLILEYGTNGEFHV